MMFVEKTSEIVSTQVLCVGRYFTWRFTCSVTCWFAWKLSFDEHFCKDFWTWGTLPFKHFSIHMSVSIEGKKTYVQNVGIRASCW